MLRKSVYPDSLKYFISLLSGFDSLIFVVRFIIGNASCSLLGFSADIMFV